MKRSILILPIILFATELRALPNQLEETLNQQYKDQTYILRQPMTAPTQQYDSRGNSPTASALGPWTVYGRVQIKKIRVEPSRLLVEGQRIGMKFSNHAKMLVPAKSEEKVRLEISLSEPLNSSDQVHDIFSHIFSFTKGEFLDTVPEFWRKYLTDYVELYENEGTHLVFKPRAATSKEKTVSANSKPADNVYHVGKDVTAPKGKYTPDPDYSDAARRERFSGGAVFSIIVDETGNVRKAELTQPAGLGLDENAYRTMKSWKFQPATHNGHPVAVEVNAEFTFTTD